VRGRKLKEGAIAVEGYLDLVEMAFECNTAATRMDPEY
jgi:hypothetical protein